MKETRNTREIIESEYLNSILDYRDGALFWKKNAGPKGKKNRLAGSDNGRGYLQVKIRGRLTMAHRIVWVMHNGDIPEGFQIDHINHVRNDNRISNLRLVTGSGNNRNTSLRKDNSSGRIGVYWRKDSRKWSAKIRVDDKLINIGTFREKSDAIAARELAEIKYGFHENHGAERI
ncbi:HNH endonuclease [Citrobacter portucalensis]|uniref:HNH endonuclease n=1 Tax=Citrobacter portucalensis TaxID=1639133 RepID=UPI0024E0DD86|nr:HNH endonuclease [Citrobacter portucalensis]WOU46057.1 HNH endonuclease [Citrobacter portucalensis]